VGVTFTGRHVPGRVGTQHVVTNVAFDDWKTWPPHATGSSERKCVARIELRWFLDAAPDGEWPNREYMHYPPKRYAFFTPADRTRGEKPWRTLAINVGPEETTAFWDTNRPVPMGPLRRSEYSLFARLLRETEAAARNTDLGPLDERRVGVMVFAAQCTLRRL